MILTDYYRFERTATKAKTRLDCAVSTGGYPAFEMHAASRETRATECRDAIAAGDLIGYFGDTPPRFKTSRHRVTGLRFNIGGCHVSSIFVPDPLAPYGYGDSKNTSDCLLFVLHGCELVNGAVASGAALEVFVARGQSRNVLPLYELLCDGRLDDEIARLRTAAVPRHEADESREQGENRCSEQGRGWRL